MVREDLGFLALKALITGGADFKEKDTNYKFKPGSYNPINQEANVKGLLQIQASLDYLVSSRRAWSTLQA